ncbi:LIF receptor subunit alpha a [Gouania willdenowi]|uniref:Leukemia inhibitory factor receptor-like n=1 Tax=Gouania willdenowi TaxID=441366 RepID=A0A8C5H9A3_GOUWI|nr:leukemia inhibitory factor receptor-like [Gouania willdenowi]
MPFFPGCQQGLSPLVSIVTMSSFSISLGSKLHSSFVLLIVFLLCQTSTHTRASAVLSVPAQLSLSADENTQQLSISWLGGGAETFDVLILRTEFNETVFYESVSAKADPVSGRYQYNWTSVEPLECTSLSVRIRSRDGHATSEWSDTQINQGRDLPNIREFRVYPLDRIVPAGTTTTFCCIVEEGYTFDRLQYGSTVLNVTRLSRRSYAYTVSNQEPSHPSGTNVPCKVKSSNKLAGTVVFVGYPPLPTNLVCETNDLTSAVCMWNKGRDTHLGGRRETRYSLNKRDCGRSSSKQTQKECRAPQWEGNWTLVAVNPLGQHILTDSAELSHRVRPVAPYKLSAAVQAWNATVQWEWKYDGYSSLALACQVEVTTEGSKTKRVFSGVGLRSVLLTGLYPDEDYSVQVRCGAQQNFWKWGNWSEPISFRSNMDVPDVLDVWMWINKDNTAKVFWKPLSHRQSHGQITNFEVTLWNPEENRQHTEVLPRNTYDVSVNLTHMVSLTQNTSVIATVVAKNTHGTSQPASIALTFKDVQHRDKSRTANTDGGFHLSWQSNTSCSLVVEWHESSCMHDCKVEWNKVEAGSSNVSIQSENLEPGVRYDFSLYSCPSDAPELLQQWEGYAQELVPSSLVPLSIMQQESDVLLSWGEIPLVNRRGFLLGYNVYISNDSQLTLLANLSHPGLRSYRVKGLPLNTYKFTVKAFTSAGEDTGTTASITLEPFTDWLLLEILVALGSVSLLLIIVTFICFKQRKWVKNAFYPEIPEPKLPSDWSRTQGPLDVKPSPHSMVHIVEKPEWDSSKEVLVVIPEEDENDEGQGIGDEPMDTDEPTSLSYYNHVEDERPIRPRFPDSTSSASSLDSAQTDVTYTGIQTSGSSLVFQVDPQASSEGHRNPPDPSMRSGGGYRPQMQQKAPSNSLSMEPLLEPPTGSAGGYKPQSSWHLDTSGDTAERGSLAPSLGSPTSIASTQFLLPDEEEHEGEEQQSSSAAATWFSNLMSSTKN